MTSPKAVMHKLTFFFFFKVIIMVYKKKRKEKAIYTSEGS